MTRCCVIVLFLGSSPALAGEERKTTVGMPGHVRQLLLPGTELEVLPHDRKTPVIVHIAEAYRHGSAYRYDITYYGLEPGEYDLAKSLRRKDGSSTGDLPPIRVSVEAALPPGQVLPHGLEHRGSPWLGGYRLLLLVLAILWVVGLGFLVFWRRRKKGDSAAKSQRVVTFADRLRPLVERAAGGGLQREERAELERMLLSYWTRRLKLDDMKPERAFALLREHADAGPLLRQLESWLHRPQPDQSVDVSTMLRLYQDLPEDVGDRA